MGRAWIIGNGPSLTPDQLSALLHETTFATGRIFKMYEKTKWRPDFYVMAETLGRLGVPGEIRLRNDFLDVATNKTQAWVQIGLKGLFNNLVQSRFAGYKFFTTCLHYLDVYNPPETWHLPEFCSYGSSVHTALQIAHMLGYSPLYLIGCDCEGGHFKDYGDIPTSHDMWIEAHKIAHNSNVEIYNATDGGVLEVYPRVKMVEVLDGV